MVNSRHERGQLVLIAAILVATAILGAVVLLNAVHSSPNVKAQSDAQSLADTDQMTEQLHRHVRKLFFATSTGAGESQQAFARNDAVFRSNVSAYGDELGPFVSREKPTVTNVTYVDGAEGDFVAGTIPSPVPEQVMSDAESIPYLRVNASSAQQPVGINIIDPSGVGANKRIVLDGPDTKYGDVGSLQDCSLSTGRVTLVLTHGTGEIRGANSGICQFTLYERGELSSYTVEIGGPGTGGGTFNISGVGSGVGNSSFAVFEPDVIVNPTVKISYQTPSVAYDSEYTLFTEADR